MRTGKRMRLALALAFSTGPGVAVAQGAPQAVFDQPEAAAPAAATPIAVNSPFVKAGGAIPLEFTRYGRNLAPPVTWSGAPHATRSYVILVEDTDTAPAANPHWLIWNIPGQVGALSRGTKNTAEPDRPKGARQGVNGHGGLGWSGPHPPVGGPPHHYHLQVLALDRTLSLAAGADREHLVAALRGHVMAKGEIVGTFAGPAQTPAPATLGQKKP